MAVSREFSVLELEGPRLIAITAAVSGTRIAVKRWLTAVRPETVAADSAAAVGEWIGSEFQRAGLPRGRVVLAVSRGDIVLKQLTIPTSEAGTVTDAELAGIVRLQMRRQLTMPLDGTAIDYLPIGGPKLGSWSAAATSRIVMAGAMPADRVAWCREVTAKAGLKLRRIGLRCFGAAAVLAELSQRRAAPVLGLAIGSGSTEFVVVEDGVMTFARAVDIPRPVAKAEFEAFAEKVAVEAKRTWMSYRASKPGGEAELVGVVGEGELARAVGERCAAGLSCSWDMIGAPAYVEWPAHMPESDRSLAAPLVGMLAETVLERPSMDFANPRRLPDTAARRRQAALIAMLGLIVIGGVGFITADRSLGRLRTELAEAQQREDNARKELDQFFVKHARVSHFERWAGANADWLAYLEHLGGLMPDRTSGQLDQVTARIAATPAFSSGSGGAYLDGTWSAKTAVTFDLDGKVDSRQIASELRERLLGAGLYEVESQGPDVPDKFSIRLTARLPSPVPPAQPQNSTTPPKTPATKGGKT